MRKPTLTLTSQPNADHIAVQGFANEGLSDALADLMPRLKTKTVIFDFHGMTSINSSGIRAWTMFLRPFSKTHAVAVERCSQPFVEQLNMVPILAVWTDVRSLLVPVQCPSCRREANELVEKSAFRAWANGTAQAKCASCGAVTESIVELDAYFSFLDATPPPI